MAKITPDVLKAVNDDINNLKAKKPLQNYKAPTPAPLQGIDRSVLSNINTDIGNMNAGNNLQFAQQPTPTPTPTVPEPTVNPQTAAIQSYLQSQQPTEEEQGLNTRIAEITGQALGGQTRIGGEAISSSAMVGRKNFLGREALAQAQPLQARVASLLANRTANQATTIGDTTYSPTGEALYTKPTEAESTKPVSLAQGATLVDPTTGQVIASGTPKPEDTSVNTVLTEIDGNRVLINKDTGEVIKNLGVAGSGDSSSVKTQLTEIGGRRVMIDKQTGEIVKDLGPAGTQQQEMETTYQNILSSLDSLGPLFEDIPKGLTGQLQGRLSTKLKKTETNTKIAYFEAVKDTLGMTITRLFEKGRISDQDRLFYLRLMPTINDTSAVVQSKITSMKEAMDNKFGSTNKTSSGISYTIEQE